MRGMMGGFYKLSEWIMRLAVINLLWLICSLPFWFVLWAQLVSASNGQEAAAAPMILLLAVLSPFTFFPATSAMFSVARKWVTGDVDVPLLRTFFRNYKHNFKQAMLGGILYSVLFAIMIIDFRVYLHNLDNLQLLAYLFIALMVLLSISLLHFFSLLSHFHMKTMQLLKNALFLTIGRPFRSFFMAVGVIAVYLISSRFTWMFPFFFGSIIATFTFYNFNFIITKMMQNAGEAEAAESIAEEEQETKS
ncbi:YesL family protein [Cohnella pontilimi]|nr:DUF624 domain-containing protein [Cohnella pontilimi]